MKTPELLFVIAIIATTIALIISKSFEWDVRFMFIQVLLLIGLMYIFIENHLIKINENIRKLIK